TVMSVGAGSTAAAGLTERILVSGGKDAGTLTDVAIDAGVGAVTAGLLKGGSALLKKALPTKPPTAQANQTRVLDSEEAFKAQYAQLRAGAGAPRLQPTATTPVGGSVDDLLRGAVRTNPGRLRPGRAEQYTRPGGFSQANADFAGLSPANVRSKGSGIRVGQLSD